MREKKYNLVKALSWYTAGSIFIKSINFLTLRLFTDLLSTTDYGMFGIYQSYLSIFEMVILFGTVHTIRMVRYDNEIDYDKYISSIIVIPVVGMVILVSISQLLGICFQRIADLTPSIWMAIFLSSGFSAVSNIIVGKVILEGQYKRYIIYSFINSILNLGISLVLCYVFLEGGDIYWARIIGTLVASVISCLYLMYYTNITRPSVEYIKKGILWGGPLLLHAVATQVLMQIDKIAISQLDAYSAVGIYTVASSIVAIPTLILTSIENSWSPWFFESLSKKTYCEIYKKNSVIIVLFALIISLFILGCPEIVKVMTNKEYWDAVYVLIPLSIATFAELIYLMPLNVELFYMQNRNIWKYTIFVVMVNICLDVFLIMLYGYMTAAYVTCIARFILYMLHYIKAKRIDRNYIMDTRYVLLCSVGLFIVDAITVFLQDEWMVRWGLILIASVSLGRMYLKRNKWRTIL